MFQFHIKGYGLKGDGSGYAGAYPFQLILRVVGVSEASPKNVWLNDYDTVAHAKTDAASVFSSVGASGVTWTDSDNEGTSVVVESLSALFTPSWGTGSITAGSNVYVLD